IVTALDVVPGIVSRPGTTVWGEILDPTVLDVRCNLTPQDADTLRVGQLVEVQPSTRGSPIIGKVVYIGLAADPKSGRVPVLARLDNPDSRLRCYVDVKVRFRQ